MHNYSVECPECGSPRAATESASLDENGNRIRLRKCDGCGGHFTTLEVAIPFSFSAADALKHEYRDAKLPPRKTKDRFVVTRETGLTWRITHVQGQRAETCRKGLHRLVGDNVYVNPTNGQRVCQPCRRESARARYHHMMDHMPQSIRDERNARNREYLRQNRAKRREYQREWARRKRAEEKAA